MKKKEAEAEETAQLEPDGGGGQIKQGEHHLGMYSTGFEALPTCEGTRNSPSRCNYPLLPLYFISLFITGKLGKHTK